MTATHTLGAEKFISLNTFRKDGTAVATPVWVVEDQGRLYVWTGAESWKVKRIRNNPKVTLAPCTRLGKVTGPSTNGTATLVAVDSRPELWGIFQQKYGLTLRFMVLLERTLGALHIGNFHKMGGRTYVEIRVME